MNIVIISPGTLPVPAVKGGAVENLIETFIKENEISGQHNITLFSIYSKKAIDESKKYKYCNFEFINMNSNLTKIKKGIRYLINKHTKFYIGSEYIEKVVKRINLISDYDVLLIENRAEFSIRLSKLKKGKIVLHLHNDILNDETKLSREILKSCNKIITVSNFIGERIKTIENNSKIMTVYNGIDTERFNKENYVNTNKKIKVRYGIDNNDIIIFYAGRLNANKGVKELMEAFLNLNNYNNIKLLIAGSVEFGKNKEDQFTSNLKELAQKSNGDIKFTGYINYENLPEIYSVADIVVIPSIGTEAAPLTVIEAISMGMPVVVSDSGGIPELVNENCSLIVKRNNDYVNDLTKALDICIKNKDLRISMGINARKYSLNFDKKRYCENLNKALKTCIES